MSHLRRQLVAVWARALLVIAFALAMPTLYPLLMRVADPGRERLELAWALERQQRAAGDIVVTPTGERRRAVVVTPAAPSEQAEKVTIQELTRWGRLLALFVVLGAATRTYHVFRAARDAAPAHAPV